METNNKNINDETYFENSGQNEVEEKRSRNMKIAGAVGGGAVAGAGIVAIMSFMPAPENVSNPEAGAQPIAPEGVEPDFDGSQVPIAYNVNDDMSFGEAHAAARSEVGRGGVFPWRNNVYSTYYAEEWEELSDNKRAAFSSYQYEVEFEQKVEEEVGAPAEAPQQVEQEKAIEEEVTVEETKEEKVTVEETATTEEQVTVEETTTTEEQVSVEETTTTEEQVTVEETTTTEEQDTVEETTTTEEADEIVVVVENEDNVTILNAEQVQFDGQEVAVVSTVIDGQNVMYVDTNLDGNYDIAVVNDTGDPENPSIRILENGGLTLDQIQDLHNASNTANDLSDFNNEADISNFV